jgi:hypothetical protein
MLDREEQIKLAFVFYIYASCLFLYGSDVILITISVDSLNLSASCFLVGAVLFVIANLIQIQYATGFNKFLVGSIIFADVMFVVGSIMFYPDVNHAIVGNWIF